MELIAFVLILAFVAEAALRCGADTRFDKDERNHVRNW
jgi:hypothetical protein